MSVLLWRRHSKRLYWMGERPSVLWAWSILARCVTATVYLSISQSIGGLSRRQSTTLNCLRKHQGRNWDLLRYWHTVANSLTHCKIWHLHGGDYEECRLLRYKNPFRTSQETLYFSTTETNRLMLCKIWCFHGDDYEECRLLGYKNPVRTSQETHYFSATESSRLMLCKIWGFHGGDCEEWRLMWCYSVWLLWNRHFGGT
jgi:hypothetical protein